MVRRERLAVALALALAAGGPAFGQGAGGGAGGAGAGGAGAGGAGAGGAGGAANPGNVNPGAPGVAPNSGEVQPPGAIGTRDPSVPDPGTAPGVPNPTGPQGNPALVDEAGAASPNQPQRPGRRDVTSGNNRTGNNLNGPGVGATGAGTTGGAGGLGGLGGISLPGSGFSFSGSVGTAPGDIARGMGAYAAGAGDYNVKTAVANAISGEAAARFNEYMYQSQQIRNQRYYARLARERQQDDMTADVIYRRLRDNPEPRDIASGAALNVVLDELTAPSIYIESVRGASEPIATPMVRNIPFRYATHAVTISLNDLLTAEPPAVLRNRAFAADRQALIAAADAANAQLEKGDQIEPETLDQIRSAADRLWDRFDTMVRPGTAERREGENYLKGVYAMSRMLESPQLDRYLGELDEQKGTTLGGLIAFMNAFNLRFGAAEKPAEVDAYQTLYPMMTTLRNQVVPPERQQAAPGPITRRSDYSPAEYFSNAQINRRRAEAAANEAAAAADATATPAAPQPGIAPAPAEPVPATERPRVGDPGRPRDDGRGIADPGGATAGGTSQP